MPQTRKQSRASQRLVGEVEWTIHGQDEGRRTVREAKRILRKYGSGAQLLYLHNSMNRLMLQVRLVLICAH